MSFNPSIPMAFDIVRESQDEIQTNFQEANTIFGVNHYDFTDAEAGKHKYSVYRPFNDDNVSPPVLNDEVVVFNEEVEGERNNLKIRYQDAGFVFSYTPYLQCHLNLVSTPRVGFTEVSESVNFDLDRSSWNGRTILIYFIFPAPNINYYVEITRDGTYTSGIPLQVKNKKLESFEIDNAGLFANGNGVQIRVL